MAPSNHDPLGRKRVIVIEAIVDWLERLSIGSTRMDVLEATLGVQTREIVMLLTRGQAEGMLGPRVGQQTDSGS